MFKNINDVKKYQNFDYANETAVDQAILEALQALAPTPRTETIVDVFFSNIAKNQQIMDRL